MFLFINGSGSSSSSSSRRSRRRRRSRVSAKFSQLNMRGTVPELLHRPYDEEASYADLGHGQRGLICAADQDCPHKDKNDGSCCTCRLPFSNSPTVNVKDMVKESPWYRKTYDLNHRNTSEYSALQLVLTTATPYAAQQNVHYLQYDCR